MVPFEPISESYYKELCVAADELIDHGNKWSDKPAFRSFFKEHVHLNGVVNSLEDEEKNLDMQMNYLIIMEIHRVYLMLGYKRDEMATRKEAYAFAILFCKLVSKGSLTADDYQIYINNSVELSVISLKLIGIIQNEPTLDRGYWSVVAEQYDDEMYREFRVCMYRFASLAAKADGVISDQEQKVLTELVLTGAPKTEKESPVEKTEETSAVNTNDLNGALRKLDELIGLDGVKDEVKRMVSFIQVQQLRQQNGLAGVPISYHCVFTGNPGTGKTTVSRILAEIYKAMGILKGGQLIETDRSGLVAEYVGQTAVKTNKVIDKALDGILFIDEAYSLSNRGEQDFGYEAIATLLKRMEDDRDRLVVILAGYNNEMKGFIDSNPGLQSRFNRYIHFEDYTAEELFDIICLNFKKYQYTLDTDAVQALRERIAFDVEHKGPNFGNARHMRNLFEKILEHQAMRVAGYPSISIDKLTHIQYQDIIPPA